MVFRSKIDSFYIRCTLVAILLIAAASFVPLLFEGVPLLDFVIVTIAFGVTTCAPPVGHIFYPVRLFGESPAGKGRSFQKPHPTPQHVESFSDTQCVRRLSPIGFTRCTGID